MNDNNNQAIGEILSNSSSREASFQIYRDYERGSQIHEGMLVIIENELQKILARIGSITPFNSFYQKGDLWSSVRREKQKLPSNISNEYEVGTLELLMRLSKENSVKGAGIRFPPKPGDPVYMIDPKKNIEEMFGIKRDQDGIIWYGSLMGYSDVPLPLDVEKIPMHMGIFGVTGSGKSYDTGALIEQLSGIKVKNNSQISYPMVIIDANGDYEDYYDDFKENRRLGAVTAIRKFVFSHSPESRSKTNEFLENIGVDLDSINPRDLAEMIMTYYKKNQDQGSNLAISLLQDLFYRIKDDVGDDIAHYFERQGDFQNLKTMVDELSKGQSHHSGTARAAKRALDKFMELEYHYKLFSSASELKSDGFIDRLIDNGNVYIIDFSADGAPGVSIEAKQFVLAYIASLLYSKFTEYKINDVKHTKYCIFMIEEAQNFCPGKSYPVGSSIAHSILSAIATQGRKFGLSLCLVSQRPSFLDPIIVSMCNTFFIHRVAPDDVSFVRKVCGGLPNSLDHRLTLLNTGNIIVTGQMTTVPFPFLIDVRYQKDRKIPHTAGETKVVQSLIENRKKL